jgi:hypothetical protein
MPKQQQPNSTPDKKPPAPSVKRVGEASTLKGRSKLFKGFAIFADLDLASSLAVSALSVPAMAAEPA